MRSLIDVLEWSTSSGDVIIQQFFTRKTCCWRRRRCSLMRINIWKPKYFSSCSRDAKERIWFVFRLLYAVVCILFRRNFFDLRFPADSILFFNHMYAMHFVEAFGVGCHPYMMTLVHSWKEIKFRFPNALQTIIIIKANRMKWTVSYTFVQMHRSELVSANIMEWNEVTGDSEQKHH